jgi:hypothetical protein
MRDSEDKKQDFEGDPTTEKGTSEEGKRFDYDNLWKTVLKCYFWEALKIFLPELYDAADRDQKPEFLEQELQKVTFDLDGGINRTDLLAKVRLKDGNSELTLCHTEVQGKGGGDLALRMYKYKEAIHLIYGREPVGIALITDKRPKGEKTFYSSEQFRVRVLYEYINVVVLELEDELLLAEEDRLGLVLYAAKCAWKSGNDEKQKLGYLRKISTLWAERGWDPKDKRLILQAIEYLMHFDNEDYVKQFIAHLESLVKSLKEGEREMYISAFEKVYKEEGRKEGYKDGQKEGYKDGQKEGYKDGQKGVARNMLNKGLPVDTVVEYSELPREEVLELLN